jgi:hypothetical protein
MSQSVFARLRWIPVVPSPASQYSVPYMPMRKLRQILARRSFLDWIVFAGLLALSLYAGNRLSSGTTWIDARAKIYQAFTVFGRNDRLPQRTAVVLLDDTDYWIHFRRSPRPRARRPRAHQSRLPRTPHRRTRRGPRRPHRSRHRSPLTQHPARHRRSPRLQKRRRCSLPVDPQRLRPQSPDRPCQRARKLERDPRRGSKHLRSRKLSSVLRSPGIHRAAPRHSPRSCHTVPGRKP